MALTLVLNKSSAFIDFQKERFFAENGVSPENTQVIKTLGHAGSVGLFGDAPASILELENTDQIKSTLKQMSAMSEAGSLKGIIDSHLFMHSKLPRTGTKKLEQAVAESGGRVIVVTAKKNEPSIVEQILNELNLNQQTRRFLVAYVGEDYDTVLPLVRSISSIPKEAQKAITEEDLYIRLPQPEGSLAPWMIEKPLLAGNVSETIKTFRRITSHVHYLVVLSILTNKFTGAYKVSALLDSNPRMSDKDLAAAADVAANTLWLLKKYHKDYGTQKLNKVLSILTKLDGDVKGMSSASPVINFELSLVRISDTLRS